MSRYLRQVAEFHAKFQPGRDPKHPTLRDTTVRNKRVRLLREELHEFEEATEALDLNAMAKELADLLYVAFGAALEFGIPIDHIFGVVHESNMQKVWTKDEIDLYRANPGNPLTIQRFQPVDSTHYVAFRDDGKVVKPPSYQAPKVNVREGRPSE